MGINVPLCLSSLAGSEKPTQVIKKSGGPGAAALPGSLKAECLEFPRTFFRLGISDAASAQRRSLFQSPPTSVRSAGAGDDLCVQAPGPHPAPGIEQVLGNHLPNE